MTEKTFEALHPHVLERQTIHPPSSKRLERKIVIVTGGARGIGEETVRLFARHGATVVIADVDTAGTALADSLPPNSATFIHCDVSLEEDIENLVDATILRYGRIDIFFNNAGVVGDDKNGKSIVDLDIDEFEHVMRVNVRGAALGIKHAARVMIPRGGGGCIISMASVAGVMGGLAPHGYTASKHAIVGLTKNTACELGQYGIRVNSISPWGLEKMEEPVSLKGPDSTPRALDLAVAEAALYLASDESKYVSGHNLVLDGGFSTSTNCVGL